MNPGGLDDTGIAATTLRPCDVRCLPESDLLTGAVDISREITRLEALRVAVVGEIDERAVSFDVLGFRSVTLWLAASTLLEVPAASRILALGKALQHEPEIADAFHTGTLSADQRRADAFGEILRKYLDSGAAPVEGGERPHLSLHVNARDLARTKSDHEYTESGSTPDLFGDKDIATMPWTGPLSIATARRLACDCRLTPIVMNDGVPIDVGRTSRTVSKKQRRALISRDHGCAFPGCGAPPAHCEGHHVVHWADGGPTDLDNLVLLCRYHHRLLHHSHWQVKIGTDRQPWFTPPTSVDPYRKPIPAHNRAGPRAA